MDLYAALAACLFFKNICTPEFLKKVRANELSTHSNGFNSSFKADNCHLDLPLQAILQNNKNKL